METLGRHFLLDLEDCDANILDDLNKIEEILVAAAREAKATIIESRFHKFNPFGISGVVVIAESHLAIHTWPEHAFAAVDIFTCGKTLEPTVASDYLIKSLHSKAPSLVEIKRGPSSSHALAFGRKDYYKKESAEDVSGKMSQMVP